MEQCYCKETRYDFFPTIKKVNQKEVTERKEESFFFWRRDKPSQLHEKERERERETEEDVRNNVRNYETVGSN